MPMYRKKPVVIEAREWTGANAVDLLAWIGPGSRQDGKTLVIPTLEGDHEASLGDMIIQGIKGEFYPCKPDIFVATYETADTPAPQPADDGWTAWEGGECPVTKSSILSRSTIKTLRIPPFLALLPAAYPCRTRQDKT